MTLLYSEETGSFRWSVLISVLVLIALTTLLLVLQPKPVETNQVTYIPYLVNVSNTPVTNYYTYEVSGVGVETNCKGYELDSGKGVVLACKVE